MASREAYSTLALRMQGLYAIELKHIYICIWALCEVHTTEYSNSQLNSFYGKRMLVFGFLSRSKSLDGGFVDVKGGSRMIV
jgi:hypothetical protein